VTAYGGKAGSKERQSADQRLSTWIWLEGSIRRKGKARGFYRLSGGADNRPGEKKKNFHQRGDTDRAFRRAKKVALLSGTPV